MLLNVILWNLKEFNNLDITVLIYDMNRPAALSGEFIVGFSSVPCKYKVEERNRIFDTNSNVQFFKTKTVVGGSSEILNLIWGKSVTNREDNFINIDSSLIWFFNDVF